MSAACYAQKGNLVYLYEKDRARRKSIASGKAPFFEPDLDQLLKAAFEAGSLEVVEDPRCAGECDFSLVSVGTPARKDGSVDLSAVLAACRDIARTMKGSPKYHILAIRSTVFPGSTSGAVRKTVEKFSGRRAGRDFGLVTYPEFLREGSAVHDMLHPDRIVIGESDRRAGDTFEGFLREFYGEDRPPILHVTPPTAEMIKYASNAFLATRVAFINEIANLCEFFEGADVERVANGMGYDHRIGRSYLNAGLGFGGSCFPKDLRALALGSRRHGIRTRIAEATLESNRLQPLRVIRLARELIPRLKGKRAAVLGLSFKPGTSDMREAPSIKIVRALLKAGMDVCVYDPEAMKNAAELFGNTVSYANGIRDCLEGANCCFIVTEWEDFRGISSGVLMETMSEPIVIDGRRVLDSSRLDPRITYRAIGLGKHEQD